ncbi:hypothetical protein HDU93_008003 [Gonapodya sp. JEL0774]|nr:hypothetical protein HDU93_008003 [Gonapodya sp. JEL0774]
MALPSNIHVANAATRRGEVKFHVKNIPFSATWSDILQAFSPYGTVVNVQIPEERARETVIPNPEFAPCTFSATGFQIGYFGPRETGSRDYLFCTEWESTSAVISAVTYTFDFVSKTSKVKFSCNGTDFRWDSRFKDQRANVEKIGSNSYAVVVTLSRPPRFFVLEHDPQGNNWNEEDSWKRIHNVFAYLSTPVAGVTRAPQESPPISGKSADPLADAFSTLFLFDLVSSGLRVNQRTLTTLPASSFPSFDSSLSFRVTLTSTDDYMLDFRARANSYLFLDTYYPTRSILCSRFSRSAQLTDTGFDFGVFYHLEVLLSNGIISRGSPSLGEIASLLRTTNTRVAIEALKLLYDPTQRLVDGLKNVQDAIRSVKRNTKKSRAGIPGHCVLVLKAIITPTRVCLLPAQIETSNRVLRGMKSERHISEDRFLRVEFRDEAFDQKVFGTRLPQAASLIHRISDVLNTGIVIGSRRYEYLASSASQLRDHQAWFFSQAEDTDAQSIREWMGDFSDIKIVAKYNARLGQVFSTTRATEVLERAQKVKIPDVERYGYCFSDGVGFISPDLATKVAIRLNLRQGDPTPSAYQIRMGGCKGVLSVNFEHSGNTVCYRGSQEKFPSEHSILEVCQPARMYPAFLNRQLITLLSTLGVPDRVFLDLQRRHVTDLTMMLENSNRARTVLGNFASDTNTSASKLIDLVMAGFFDVDDAFLMNALIAFRQYQMKDLQKRTHVPVSDMAVVLMGIADETKTHVLKPGQIYASYWDPISQTKRFAFAVDYPEFSNLLNVVVFSVLGDRPLPNMLSGGDLDGDIFWITADDRFFPPTTDPPMDYKPPPPRTVPKVTITHVKEFFTDFIQNDNLGLIANAHLVKADKSAMGARDPDCLKLAELHSQAVDYCKTGIPAPLDLKLLPKEYPTFMEKKDKRTYVSKKVIGLMFDEIVAVAENNGGPNLQPRKPHPLRRLYRPNQTIFEMDAQDTCRRYYRDLTAQMNHFGVRDEVQLVTGFVLKVAKWLKRKRRLEAKKQITDSVSVILQQYRQEFWEEFLGDEAEAKARLSFSEISRGSTISRPDVAAKAAAWYKVGYEYQEDEERGKRNKMISFGFVVWDVLCEMMAIGAVGIIVLPQTRRALLRPMGIVASIFGYEYVEQPHYEVLYSSPHGFEVRRYPELIVAQTTYEVINGSVSGGFMTVAGYIFGKNRKRGGNESEKVAMTAPVMMDSPAPEKIAMTAPVLMDGSNSTTSTGPKTMTMSFVMPTKYKHVEDLPEPLDPRVRITTRPASTLAVLRRSGSISLQLTQSMTAQLLVAVAQDDVWEIDTEPDGRNAQVTTAGYNPPWTLPWLKRNEALVANLTEMPPRISKTKADTPAASTTKKRKIEPSMSSSSAASSSSATTPSFVFTVKKNSYYPSDGFHSPMEPETEFVGSFTSVVEANKCVEDIFYNDNPWGSDPDEMEEMKKEGDFKRKVDNKTGLVKLLSMSPPDSEVWEVTAQKLDVMARWMGVKAYKKAKGDSHRYSSGDEGNSDLDSSGDDLSSSDF